MGQPKMPAAPNYKPGNYYESSLSTANGEGGQQQLFHNYRNKFGGLSSENNYNPQMLAQNQAANTNIQNLLGSLGQFSNGTGPQGWQDFANKQAQTYGNMATNQFMQGLQPALRNINQQTAAQFGTGNTSAMADRMAQEQQQVMQPALQQIGQQAALMGPQLTSQYVNNLIGMLGANQSVPMQNLQQYLSGTGAAENLSNTGNQQWLQNQQNQNNLYGEQLQGRTASTGMQAMGALAPIAGGLIGSIFGPVGTALGGALGGGVGQAFGGGGSSKGGSTGNAINMLMNSGGMY